MLFIYLFWINLLGFKMLWLKVQAYAKTLSILWWSASQLSATIFFFNNKFLRRIKGNLKHILAIQIGQNYR